MAGWPAGPGSHALLVALTAQTHSPGPCSHVLLVALATQTHSPVTRWLAQWLSDCVSLAFQLRRHFAAHAFSAFVSTGWLAGPCSHALLVALTAQTYSPGPCSHVLLVALTTQTHIPVAGWLAQWLSDCVSLAFQLRRHFAAPAFSAFVSTGWLAGPCSHALLVALTAQTHSPAPCSHALLVALTTQTHIPEAGWLAQWLSDSVFLAFQLRRHFAAPAFSTFVSTGWLAGRLALVHIDSARL